MATQSRLHIAKSIFSVHQLKAICRHLRWYSHYRCGSSSFHPPNPIVSSIISTILEVPIISCVGVAAKRIVSSDSISAPSREGGAKLLDVRCIRWEINAINKGRYRVANCLVDTRKTLLNDDLQINNWLTLTFQQYLQAMYTKSWHSLQ